MRVTWKQWVLLLLGLLSMHGTWAQPACERYELQSPKRDSQIADRQPELQWGGDPAASYRVQVAVVLPEGRVLESTDTVVTGTKWRPGAPVSVLTSVFKVIVSRNCPTLSIQDLNAQGPYFIVQAAEQCALKPMSLRQQGSSLRWEAATSVDRYKVQLFSVVQAADGEVVTRRFEGYDVSGSSWSFPSEMTEKLTQRGIPDQSWVATVQAYCGSLISQPQAVKLLAGL